MVLAISYITIYIYIYICFFFAFRAAVSRRPSRLSVSKALAPQFLYSLIACVTKIVPNSFRAHFARIEFLGLASRASQTLALRAGVVFLPMLGDQHAGWHNIASSNALALDFFVEYEHVLAILPAFGSWLGMSHARPAAAEHETYRARCKRHDGHDDHEDHRRVLDRFPQES